MIDDRILELLSRSLDEPLETEERRCLDEALASSAELREIARDLETIREVAAEPLPECPPHVFGALEARVARRYPRRRLGVLFGRRLAGGLAAAALLALVLWTTRAPESQTGPDRDPDLMDARVEVAAAQARFHEAIARMERLAHARLAEMPSELAHGYAVNLEVINAAIADCERMAAEIPGHAPNYLALSKAYEAKVELLEMIIEG